jgi:hypothetical protein
LSIPNRIYFTGDPSHLLPNAPATMDKRTKALFEWAASNSSTAEPVKPSSKLDPAIIDSILGPDDSQLMLESMHSIRDTSLPLDDR